MCQNNCDCGDNPRIFIPPVTLDIDPYLVIEGVEPIEVAKNKLGDVVKYTISSTITSGGDGKDGKDGVNGQDGRDGISPTIVVNSVTQGDNAQVTNVGDSTNLKLNFVLPKGRNGDNGKDGVNGSNGTNGNNGQDGRDGQNGRDGVAQGLSKYVIAVGNNTGGYIPMGNFQQGQIADTGDDSYKKLRIRAWVTVANMQNWTTLKLSRSVTPTYNGTLISQRIKHSEATAYVGQHEISAYIETSDRYIGFSFTDTAGGNYNSDGASYGDYGVEVFILS